MTQDLFDLDEALRRKDKGMALAAERRYTTLDHARRVALNLSLVIDGVTADDVYAELDSIDREHLGNSAGSIFKDGNWHWLGEWRQSTRVSNHGRYIRVWRRKV